MYKKQKVQMEALDKHMSLVTAYIIDIKKMMDYLDSYPAEKYDKTLDKIIKVLIELEYRTQSLYAKMRLDHEYDIDFDEDRFILKYDDNLDYDAIIDTEKRITLGFLKCADLLNSFDKEENNE